MMLLLVGMALLIMEAVADPSRILPLNPATFHDPKYKLEFHEPGSPFIPEDPGLEMVRMTSEDKRKFECYLPKQPEAALRDWQQQNETSITVADSKSSPKTPEELLSSLKENCMLRQEGWWTYELCHQTKFRQIHFDSKGKELQEFVLGVYDPEATAQLHGNSPVLVQKDPRSQTAAQKYYAHMYTNGTRCDLTGTPRKTEVRFVCSDSGTSLISSIKESPSCKYTVVFQAPMLCKHPLFQEERQPWLVVNCNAIPASTSTSGDDPFVEDYEQDRPLPLAEEAVSRIEMLPLGAASEAEGN